MPGPDDPSNISAHPPTEPGKVVAYVAKGRWRVPTGVLAIVLGGLGMLVAAFGAMFVLMQTSWSWTTYTPNANFVSRADPLALSLFAAACLFGACVCVASITAGVGILSRRRWALNLGLAAALGLCAYVPMFVGAYFYTLASIRESARQQMLADGWSAPPDEFGEVVRVVMAVMMLSVGLPGPLTLVVLVRRRIAADDARSWSSRGVKRGSD